MSARITVLAGDVVNRIAAGEVVERPASVVKELMENAVDAGCARVSVDVEEAGRRLIRVTDDGSGMPPDEAVLAFQRHATSKIRTEEDLYTIRTMGFRGEALPSIAAVSKVRLVTVAAGAAVGTDIRLDGGALVKQREAAAAPGTTVEVADLFYNTPARRKFLKSPATEFSHICQTVQRQALAFPAVHVRLTHNGSAVAEYPAVRSLRERVQQVYGVSLIDACVEVNEKDGALHLEGLCCRPLDTTPSRTPQDLFVNQRWVKSPAIAHALQMGYGTCLPKGHQPRFVLALHVDPNQLDVNVHPTKREVRFSDQEKVYEMVRARVKEAVMPSTSVSRMVAVPDLPASSPSAAFISEVAEPAQLYQPTLRAGEVGVGGPGTRQAGGEGPPSTLMDVRALGQIANRYLLAQIGAELLVVDQHTAHERVLFDRLAAQLAAGTIPSQQSLLPQMVELAAGEAVTVRAHLDDLNRLGFEVEEFGQGTFVVRAVPALIGTDSPQALFRSLVEDWENSPSTPSLQGRYNAVLATMACHSAVRAGREMEGVEMRRLIEDWHAAGAVSTCPHGRRVAMRLTLDELDRIFGRLGWT